MPDQVCWLNSCFAALCKAKILLCLLKRIVDFYDALLGNQLVIYAAACLLKALASQNFIGIKSYVIDERLTLVADACAAEIDFL